MAGKVKVGYLIPSSTQRQLRALAERDHRSLSGEIAWLVAREWRQHMLTLGPRRAQCLSQALAEVQSLGGPDGDL